MKAGEEYKHRAGTESAEAKAQNEEKWNAQTVEISESLSRGKALPVTENEMKTTALATLQEDLLKCKSSDTAAAEEIKTEEEKSVRTFKMEISFDGTAYHGWQRQMNGITVQEVLEDKLCKLFGNIPIRVQGSSRTDAGVHALGMVFSFKVPPSPYIPDGKRKKALSRLRPNDIRIRS